MALPPETIAYVARDIERALGTEPQEGYFVITNRTSYSENIQKQHPKYVLLVDSPKSDSLGTDDLLRQPMTLDFLASHRDSTGNPPKLLVFKNSVQIESTAKEQGWKLLNPPAALAEKIENKITQIAWLGDLARYLPPHHIEPMKNIAWNGEPFIIQWAHGHTGESTVLIRSEAELAVLRQKFPERATRITAFIQGPSFTVNVTVGADKILPGNVSYQITGIAPFTDNAFSTVGNDWKLAKKLLAGADNLSLSTMIREIGAKMRQDSWRGLFGLDFMKDTKSGKIFLIEINARQPASTTYESQLQQARRTQGAKGMTTFEAHLAALCGQPLSEPVIELADGAQIIQRITSAIEGIPDEAAGSLELAGYSIITYPNTDKNTDLIRIQSAHGIMADHGILNDIGREIKDTIGYAE